MELRQQLILRLTQRMELRQELQQELLLALPEEFASYLNIERDTDFNLLLKSLPFLSLHEFSHPLYDRGAIIIPKPAELNLEDKREYYNNAVEVGIDRAAVLIGPELKRYTLEQMFQAHYAMMERVFRDHFDLEKFPPEPTFIARLYAEIKEHQNETQSAVLRKNLERLIEKADQNFLGKVPDKYTFNLIVEEYFSVYQNTKLRG
ncbi:hypothetical protein HZC32_00630 [Candidatus Woesearchaeota archaeon]|nr:hypothetical protein [Candidatus Woesearchaeota archaeon]